MEGVVLIKRICGHSSPFTFKRNERFAKQRFDKFISKKCPACTAAAIAELEAGQRAESQRLKELKRQAAAQAKTPPSASSPSPAS